MIINLSLMLSKIYEFSYILESMRERLIIILIFTMSLKTALKTIQENVPYINF